MERLTEYTALHQAIPRTDLKNNGYEKCVKKLAEYEDMEEQGRLIKLPCKFNSTLYIVDKELKKIFEVKLQSVEVMHLGLTFNGVWNDGTDEATSFALNEEYFGDFVFLTEKEAQQALEKQKEAK